MAVSDIKGWAINQAKINFTNTKGDWWHGHAPYREDKNPSFSFNISSGSWKDFATNETGNISELARKLNIELPKNYTNNRDYNNCNSKNKVETVYQYQDEAGNTLYEVVRIDKADGKLIYQRQPDGKGGYLRDSAGKYITDKGRRLVIYRLPQIIERCKQGETRLCIAEGEKCTDLLNSLGYTATCNVSGAGKWQDEYAEQIPDEIEEVIIFPDCDKPGISHAETVKESLVNKGFTVKIVYPSYEIQENHGKDIFDYIQDGHTREDIEQLIKYAPSIINDMESPVFPIESIPQKLRTFYEIAAKSIRRPVDFIFVPSIAIFGAAIGANVSVKIEEGWEERPILFTAVVGDSGSAKTPGQKIAKEPLILKQAEADQEYQDKKKDAYIAWKKYEEDKKAAPSKEEREKIAKPGIDKAPSSAPVFYAVDTTTEALSSFHQDNPRGFIIVLDEIKSLISSMNQYKGGKGNDRQIFLSLHSGSEISVLRKGGNGKGDGRERITIPQTCISITGGIQPSELAYLIGDPNKPSDGFAPRFLMAFPEYFQSLYGKSSGLPQSERERYRDIYDKVYEFGRYKRVLEFSPEAKHIWIQIYDRLIIEVMTGEMSPALKETWSKMNAHAARIALIIHVIRAVTEDIDKDKIDKTTMGMTWGIVEYFKANAKKVYGKVSGDTGNSNFKKVINFLIKSKNKETAREIRRGCGFKNSDHTRLILNSMVNHGFLEEIPERRTVYYSLTKKVIGSIKL